MELRITLLQSLVLLTSAFAPQPNTHITSLVALKLSPSSQDDFNNISASPWNPELRKLVAGVASLGTVETAYLTNAKLQGESVLCAVDGSCQDVLNGPYSVIPLTDNVPLSALGCLAYSLTALVALAPLLTRDKEDTNNRIALLVLATGLGTFSTFLMSLLITVLHESCLYCLASASLSWTLALTVWFGGALPENEHRLEALRSSASSFLATTAASLLLFASVERPSPVNADDGVSQLPPQSPPAITTTSSPQALKIAKDLTSMNAKMFGAFWCSHCYDQKQTLGKQAFTQGVQYIECSREGMNSQAPLCKERNIPGYPTWEIDGQLFPGEQELDELEEIISKLKGAN